MTRILTVIGARPQFVKAATVSRRIAGVEGVSETLVHTGQHYDANMSDVFFDELGIPAPGHHLDIAGGSHGQMTGRMLEKLDALMRAQPVDAVLVYGDTNSTLAGALAASKLHIPVAHVEAGLRSFNRAMPEEVNRVLTDHCSDLLLTPTSTATANLAAEGLSGSRVVQVGDVMYDAALVFGQITAERGSAPHPGIEPGRYVLATIHRQANADDVDRLRAIFGGLAIVARDMPVVIPMHPRTRTRLEEAGLSDLVDTLHVTPPMGYLDMIALERGAAVVATDSGGVQKEAFFHGVPCVTLREETEWTELIEAGWNRLAPLDSAAAIADAIRAAVGTTGRDVAPYGDGNAATRIVDAMLGAVRT